MYVPRMTMSELERLCYIEPGNVAAHKQLAIARLADVEEKLDEAFDEVKSARADAADLESKNTELADQLEDAEKQINDVQDQLGEAQARVAELSDRLSFAEPV